MNYYIKQKIFTIKDKFDVTDEHQNLVYQVKGKFMSITNKLELVNPSGKVILKSNKKVLTLLPIYYIYDEFNQEVATIKRVFSLKPKFELSILHKEMTVEGSFFAHSFGIYHNNTEVASISKKIISWGDTYEISIHEEQNKEVFLFVVIILDQIIHERRSS